MVVSINGGTPNSSILRGLFPYKPSIRVPPFQETSVSSLGFHIFPLCLGLSQVSFRRAAREGASVLQAAGR